MALLGLVAASRPSNGQICDPVISLTPPFDSTTITVEVPGFRLLTIFITIRNAGCAPLTWKMRDTDPGTGLDCSWIAESPDSGTVAASDSQTVSARAGPFLTGGRYSTQLWFTSNDPVQPRLSLSITFVAVVPTEARRVTFGQLKNRFR